MMDTGVPLGVRIYDLKDGVDFWVTRWVEDFSFRHTAPGGCASCSLKLHYPYTSEFDPEQFGRLFYRVQIVDLRSAEIMWEGRIEDPAQQISDQTWELGVLGSQVAATDVRIPVLYQDNTLEFWVVDEADPWNVDKNNDTHVMEVKMKPGYLYGAGTEFITIHYDGMWQLASAAARISMTYKGAGPGAQAANFDMTLEAVGTGNVDVTAFNAAQIYKTNVIGFDFSSPNWVNDIWLEIRRRSGTGNYTIGASEEGIARFKFPKITGIRFDELGNTLIAQTDYPGDYVTVHQVVRDVIARFLNGGWQTGIQTQWNSSRASNSVYGVPEWGSVRGNDAFIDSSDTHKITNLWWKEGVDAKTVLNTMMLVQRNAFWAIWDSGHRLSNKWASFTEAQESQFRFEWAKWPTSWNYIVGSDDGMAQQLNGEQLYNAASIMWQDPEWSGVSFIDSINSDSGTTVQSGPYRWRSTELDDRFTRMQHVVYPDIVDPGSWLSGEQRPYLRSVIGATSDPLNSGILTVRRPIQMVDSGETDGGGFCGMVNPWEIRPGKLVKIKDIMPLANAGDFTFDMGKVISKNVNNGFESGTTGYGGTGGTFIQASDQKYVGSFSGKITPSGAAADVFIATNWGVIQAQKTYRSKVWVRCAVSRSITLRVDFYNATPTFISSISQTKTVAANTWTYFEVSGVAPDTTTQGPTLVVMSGTPAASNIMWLDEYYYEEVPSFPRGSENCVFRVAATEYDTGSNSCKMELDQLPNWSLSSQIVAGDAPGQLQVK